MTFDFYERAPKETVGACPLCGDKDLLLNGRFDRYGLEATSLRCWCGLVFLSPRMTAAAYGEFYRDGHYRRLLSEFYGRPITPESIEESQGNYAKDRAKWLRPWLQFVKGGSILDLGGSTGVVAEEFAKAFEMRATVIEPSAAEAARACRRGLIVGQYTLAEFDPGDLRWNLITLCQTVDHLLDIGADLTHIRRWLVRDGLFFVDFVENAPVKIDHPYYLSRETMRAYLEKAGFRIRAMEPAGDGLHVNVLAGAACINGEFDDGHQHDEDDACLPKDEE